MEWRVIRCSIKWFCIYNWRNYYYRSWSLYQIPVNIGDVVDFNYTSSAYAGENSYKVYDQNNALLFEEGSDQLCLKCKGVGMSIML